MRAEVDGAEVADGGLGVVRDLQDLGAQVGGVHRAARQRGLVGGAVGGVLEGHPAVAGLRQGAHHAGVQGLRGDRADGLAGQLGLAVGLVEVGAPQVDQLGHVGRGEQRPVLVGVDPAHELVRDPVRQVEVVGAAGLFAGVVAELQELLDVGVPGLQVDAGGALAAAALVDGGDGGVEGAQERHDAVGLAVGAADQAAARADARVGQADAAGVLGQAGDLRVAVVDRVQVVQRGVEQVAARHLRVPGAGVEERRRGGQVLQAAHQAVQLGHLAHGLLVVADRQATGDAEQEVLRGLDHLAGDRVAQQVAGLHGAQAEVLEAVVARGVDQRVQGGGVLGDELRGGVADQALGVADGDRGGEGRGALAVRLVDDLQGEQAGGQLRVLGVLGDHRRGGVHGQPAQLGEVRAGVAAAQRGSGDVAGVDLGEVGAAVGEQPQQGAAGVGDRRVGEGGTGALGGQGG